MKDQFPEHYQPSDDDFKKLWEEATFVFDANVLLDLYRYSPETSRELLNIIESVQDRIWIPHQFALEYHEHKDDMTSVVSKSYKEIISNLTSQLNAFKKALKDLKGRNTDALTNKLEQVIDEIKSQIEEFRNEHQKYIADDIVVNTVAELFSGKVGQEFDQKRLDELYKEAKQRYSRKQPPGFMDNEKPEPRKYNDYVGWIQIVEYASAENIHIIFVTNDVKDDWFKKTRGEKKPHPQLIKEMRKRANVNFHIYETANFMNWAQDYLDAQVSDQALEEVEKLELPSDSVVSLGDSVKSQWKPSNTIPPYAYGDAVLRNRLYDIVPSIVEATRWDLDTSSRLISESLRMQTQGVADAIRQNWEANTRIANEALRETMPSIAEATRWDLDASSRLISESLRMQTQGVADAIRQNWEANTRITNEALRASMPSIVAQMRRDVEMLRQNWEANTRITNEALRASMSGITEATRPDLHLIESLRVTENSSLILAKEASRDFEDINKLRHELEQQRRLVDEVREGVAKLQDAEDLATRQGDDSTRHQLFDADDIDNEEEKD